MSAENVCPVCFSSDVLEFFEILGVPVHIGLQWPCQEAARQCPRGDIRLGFCRECGFITNLAFEPARLEYTQAYENSLHFSPFFQAYARSLAARLIERYHLVNKDIIEIGCGKGDFLALLCELGNNRGVGFDPSYEGPCSEREVAKQITFIRDFYTERYASYQGDLVCCRYVFEHIPNPTGFLTALRRTLGDRLNTVVYFEVPNALFILRDLSIWDMIYEHCSYFSPGSLARAFVSCGFDVLDLTETYGGQYLNVEALPGNAAAGFRHEQRDGLKGATCDVAAFASRCQSKIETWRRHLDRIERAGQRAVVWGAGAKGVSFMNMLKVQEPIEYVVDLNPRKQGMFIAGTGQQVVPPEVLRDHRPDIVIVMNPMYKREIQQLIEGLGLTPKLLCA